MTLLVIFWLCAWLANATSASWPMLGMDAYRNYDLYNFRAGEETHEFSSYDRANHNDDGFAGTYSCLSLDSNGRCVIADYQGSGEIASIWFTYDPDSIIEVGDIIVELDGQQVLTGQVQNIVDGANGPPFIWPFVGNTNDTMGGNVIKVPMTFSSSMHITTANNPHFYHVVYRRFPAGVSPSTFDPSDAASDVVSQFTKFGVQDPKAIQSSGGAHVSKSVEIDASGSESVSLGSSCGIVSQLALRIPSIPATAYVEDDGRAFGTGGSSSMQFALDANNKQCRLTRRVDATIGNQNVNIAVDGAAAGSLNSGSAADSTWQDQTLDLPASSTNGKSAIKVTASCISSDLDCNEFYYALHCTSSGGTWKSAGYVPSSDYALMDVVNVGANNPHDEAAHAYQISGQTWVGVRQYAYNDASHASGSLPDVTLTLNFDGTDTVSEVPIGSFFGTAMAKSMVRSLMLSVDALDDNGAWTTFFPMPFSKSASITVNNGGSDLLNVTVDAVVQPCSGDAPSSSDWGYFRTQHTSGPTTPGQLWPILSSQGPGIAYGLTHTFRGAIVLPSNTLEFLEGDEQVWLNRTTPGGSINDTDVTMLGTGTEDFYESGWYFQDQQDNGQTAVPFAMPLTGLTTSVYANNGLGCVGSCLSALRLMVADSQAFGADGISFNIEHGPDGNNIQADYETCAFYYA